MSNKHELAFIIFVWMVRCLGASELPPKLQPPEDIEALDHSQRADFIVRGSESGLKYVRGIPPAKLAKPHPLNFISGTGISLTIAEAVSLAKRDDISQVWYVPSTLYPTYCRLIEAIEYAFNNNPTPSIINMSLGPPGDVMPMLGNAEEPMNAATKKASDRGFIIVMAIGNYNDGENAGTVNPWCYPEWVICVGAASSDATKVWAGSAQGFDSQPRTWPDVVANGIDVISSWPANLIKPENRRHDDESNSEFRIRVPRDEWANYTVESGTSQATAQVTRASAQIVAFVRNATERNASVREGDKLFAITVPRDRLAATSRRGPRLTGTMHTNDGSTETEITYSLVEPWRLVKQVLRDTALPMADFPPSVVGAGFVDPNYIEKQFPTPTRNNIRIQPLKVLED